jgi:alpha-tubulin suppressor-like RCC1 family protein
LRGAAVVITLVFVAGASCKSLRAFVQLSAGWGHVCARTTDGAAWCWGSNGTGQLGDGSTNARFFPWPVIR